MGKYPLPAEGPRDRPIKTFNIQAQNCVKRCSYCARHRTMSSGVAIIEHIDLTSLFTYRTMSYDIATTLTQKFNLVQFLRQCRRMSYDIVRHRSRTTSSGVIESSDVVRHRASRHPALSYDVVRSVNTA